MSVPIIIIPTYNPSESLVHLTLELLTDNNCSIIIVNDGSNTHTTPFFDQLPQTSNLTVLHHPTNMGKGQALKTGMQYALDNFKHIDRIITADCDGQHLSKDIFRMMATPLENKHSLLLGHRNFRCNSMPLRSWTGNVFMRALFFLTTGSLLKDTQTGLRAYSDTLAEKFLQIPSQRYEYEMAMLMYCKKANVQITEIPIDTIYIDKNKSSHFKPILDSVRVLFSLLSPFRFNKESHL